MSPAKKAAKKKVDWTATAPKLTRAAAAATGKRAKAAHEAPQEPGSTFAFIETKGGGEPCVWMTVGVDSKTRKQNFAIPAELQQDIREATGGVRWGIALVALADYTATRWEALAPATYNIVPALTEDESWICGFVKRRSDTLEVRLEQALKFGHNHGYEDRRTTIAVPADVRQRIERLIPEELKVTGRSRFTGTVLGMAKWALDDLRRRDVQLRIIEAPKAKS